MAKKAVTEFLVVLTCVFAGLAAGCSALDNAYVPNDCLIAAAKAQYALPANTWSRLLVVRYNEGTLQHVYLVYSEDGNSLTAFDLAHGTRRLQTAERSADRLAKIVDPWARFGWFIEDNANNRNPGGPGLKGR